ncbi:MAG: hypothetical protein H7Z38_22995, partial [Rubrivivax sp.]|nr:hypothetical protein [Pyrinomonadaceae bacterium]
MPAPCPPRRLTFLFSTGLLLLTLAGLLWSVLPVPPRAGVGTGNHLTSATDSTALKTSAATETPEAQSARLGEAYGKLPLSFEANEGQTDAKVNFISRGQGYTLFLTPTEAVLRLRIADCGLRTDEKGDCRPTSRQSET